MELPEDMMAALRGRLGQEEDDATRDELIATMNPQQVVRELCAWHLGDGGWAGAFARWVDEAGADIKKLRR